jgi:hypothetical protein
MACRAVTITIASASPASWAARSNAASADSASLTRPSSIKAMNRQNMPLRSWASSPAARARSMISDAAASRSPAAAGSHSACSRASSTSARTAGAPGQGEGLIGQGPPPGRGARVGEQLTGEPGQHPGPERALHVAPGRHFQQADQRRVSREERGARPGAQGQLHHRVRPRFQAAQLRRQGQARSRQPAGAARRAIQQRAKRRQLPVTPDKPHDRDIYRRNGLHGRAECTAPTVPTGRRPHSGVQVSEHG